MLEFAHAADIGLAVLQRAERGQPVSMKSAMNIAAFLDKTLDWLRSPGPLCSPEPSTPTNLPDGPSGEPGSDALTIPLLHWDPSLSPGALLRADVYDGVPFHGRGLELKELHDWCKSPVPVSVRLVTGAGGIGKTRLMIELCQQLQQSYWAAGFASGDSVELFRERGRTLVVLDYADATLDATRRVLAEAWRRRDRGPIRVALLARRADDWWDLLAATGGGVSELLTGSATAFLPIQAFATSSSDRLKALDIAGDALAKRLGKPMPERERPLLEGASYNLILHVHMAALAFIEGQEVKNARALLDFVLLRERRDWARRLTDRGFTEWLLPAISTVLAAVVCLNGVDSEADAVRLMQLEPRLEGVAKADLYLIAGTLRAAYQGPRWLNKLQPDPVGDHLKVVDDERHPGAAKDLVRKFREQRDGQ
jgi:hypothetical protein